MAFAVAALLMMGCVQKESNVNEDDAKYLRRCARHDVMEEEIVVIDPNSPRVITMEPWPQLIFLSADGEHTISELVTKIGSQYENGPPPELPEQVRDIVKNLASEGIIELLDSPSPLPYYLASPISDQDPEKAKRLMVQDGLIKE